MFFLFILQIKNISPLKKAFLIHSHQSPSRSAPFRILIKKNSVKTWFCLRHPSPLPPYREGTSRSQYLHFPKTALEDRFAYRIPPLSNGFPNKKFYRSSLHPPRRIAIIEECTIKCAFSLNTAVFCICKIATGVSFSQVSRCSHLWKGEYKCGKYWIVGI